MKKGIVRIALAMCVCVITPYFGLNITKADDTTLTPDSSETRNGTVISSIPLSGDNLGVYIIQDDETGIYYSYSYSSALVSFNINDKVVVCVQKTNKNKYIVRDIIKK